MEKTIKNFPDYKITDTGQVISYKYRKPYVMKTWNQKSGYENIKLCKNNKTYHFLIHRLVAEAFIPNPENLPEVNHINKNVKDNRVENLEWCDRKYNLYQSYETLSPVRNFKECSLYEINTDNFIGEFNSISEAVRYAVAHYNCSFSSLMKYRKNKNIKLVIKTKCND